MWSIIFLECTSPFHTPGLHSILDSFFFFQRKNDPKKFQDLENRFTDPKITKTRECQVLKSLQKRILEDMQQSEIIVNYLADKYDNEPVKKRVKFSSLHWKTNSNVHDTRFSKIGFEYKIYLHVFVNYHRQIRRWTWEEAGQVWFPLISSKLNRL